MASMSLSGHGGARAGAGRKPKPAPEKRSRTVSVNLTPDEHAALRRIAARQSLSSYVRKLVVRHLRRQQEKRALR